MCPLYRLYCLQEKLYSLDLNKIRAGDDKRTTLMVKNIPNKYTQKMLLAVSAWCPHLLLLLLLLLLPACGPATQAHPENTAGGEVEGGMWVGAGRGGLTQGGLEALQALRLQQLRKLRAQLLLLGRSNFGISSHLAKQASLLAYYKRG